MRQIVLPAFAAVLMAAMPVHAAPLNVPPQMLTFDALGTEVALPITADIDVVAEGDQRVATGEAIGDLGDLQAKAVTIAQSIPLPREACANPNGLNVVIDDIHTASITPEGDTARLGVLGTVTGYGCLVGVGAPVASTQVAMSAPLRIDVAAPDNIGLVLAGPVELVAAGLPPDLLAMLNDQASAALNTALAQARTGGSPLLGAVPDLKIEIADAAFFAEGDKLMVRLAGRSTMGAETFAQLVEALETVAPAGL